MKSMDVVVVGALASLILSSTTGLNPAKAAEPTQARRELRIIVDDAGQLVRSADGKHINHGAPAPTVAGVRPIVSQVDANRRAETAQSAISSSGHPAKASFSALGNCLGCTGLELYVNHGRPEAFASTTHVQLPGTTYPGTPNDAWYALRYDPDTHVFQQTFVSERLPGGIAKLLLLPGSIRDDDELAVCGLDGSVRFYSAATKKLKPTKTRLFAMQDVRSCAIGNIDGSGRRQFLLVSSYQATVFDSEGNALWSLPPPLFSYSDVIIGQMDGDRQLEIAVSQYVVPWIDPTMAAVTVYDGRTHTAQLTLDSTVLPAAGALALAQGATPATHILVVSESWGLVDGFDVASGARLWQVPTPLNIQSLKVAQGLADTAEQVLIGDGQWGAVHVVDAATGAALFDVNNPEWGVTQIAVGDLDRDGKPDLLWGADAGGGGPQRFVLADASTRTVKATSRSIDPFFTAPAAGHLMGDSSRQIVVASRTTDGNYDPGSLIVLDADSGKTIAIQEVPLFQGWGNDDAVKVADVDGDGIDDIVVAATHLYDGAVDVYGIAADRKISQKSTTWQGYGIPTAYPEFTALGLADVDRRGHVYAAVGFRQYDPTLQRLAGNVIGLDLNTGAEKWRVQLPLRESIFGAFPPTEIESLGRDVSGAELLMVFTTTPRGFAGDDLVGSIDVIRVKGTKAAVIASYLDLVSATQVVSTRTTDKRILIGTLDGNATVLQLSGKTLTPISSRMVSTSSVDAIRAGRNGDLWLTSNNRVTQIRRDGSIGWQSTDNGLSDPAGMLLDLSDKSKIGLWVSSIWRVDGFSVGDNQ